MVKKLKIDGVVKAIGDNFTYEIVDEPATYKISVRLDDSKDNPDDTGEFADVNAFDNSCEDVFGLGLSSVEIVKHIVSTKDPWFIKKGIVCCIMYKYEHSGITVSNTPFGCSWDSGPYKLIVVNTKQAKLTIKEAKQLCLSYIKAIEFYLNGLEYSYQIMDENDEIVDSLCGISTYNSDTDTNVDELLPYFREYIDDVYAITDDQIKNAIKLCLENY